MDEHMDTIYIQHKSVKQLKLVLYLDNLENPHLIQMRYNIAYFSTEHFFCHIDPRIFYISPHIFDVFSVESSHDKEATGVSKLLTGGLDTQSINVYMCIYVYI